VNNVSFKIDGQPSEGVKDWINTTLLATWPNDNVQAQISTTTMTFVEDAAEKLRANRIGGANGSTPGVFVGLPFEMNLTDPTSNFSAFRGRISQTEGYKEISPVEVEAKIIRDDNVFTINERAKGTTFSLLADEGLFPNSMYTDVPYVVEDPDKEFIQLLMLSISAYLMIQQLIQTADKIANQVVSIAATLGGGITGSLAALIQAGAILLLNVALAALQVIYLVQLGKDIIAFIISDVRYHKGIKIRTALEVAMTKFGYEFEGSMPELDYIYLPSKDAKGNKQTGQPGVGIPTKQQDVGKTVFTMLQLMGKIGYAKTVVLGNKFHLEPLINTAFWNQQASWVKPDVLNETWVGNSDELKMLNSLNFASDQSDKYTIRQYDGTGFDVVTTHVSVTNPKDVDIKGTDIIDFGIARGARKNGLTDIELAVLQVATAIDNVVNFFGGDSDLASGISGRVGMLRLSEDTFNTAKIIPLNAAGKIPANHRQIWSSEYLWDTYHVEKSFVDNGRSGQFELYEAEIPFGMQDFLTLIDYNRFVLPTGEQGRVDFIEWEVGKDKAKIKYRIQRPYDATLKETKTAA